MDRPPMGIIVWFLFIRRAGSGQISDCGFKFHSSGETPLQDRGAKTWLVSRNI